MTWFYKECGSKYKQKYTATLWRTWQTYCFFLSNQMAPACYPPPTNSPGPVPRSLWHHHPWGMAWRLFTDVLRLVTIQHDVTRVKETRSGSFLSVGTCLWQNIFCLLLKKSLWILTCQRVLRNTFELLQGIFWDKVLQGSSSLLTGSVFLFSRLLIGFLNPCCKQNFPG